MEAAEQIDRDIAALDFAALEHSEGEWTPPTNTEWAALTNPHLVSVRMAWLTLYMGKPEVMDVVGQLDEAGELESLGNGIRDSIEFFRAFLTVLEGAEARLICAGLSLGGADE